MQQRVTPADTAGRDDARCATVDPELFFTPGLERAAQNVCAACELRTSCADYALENGVEGVWGGLTVGDRRRIWRQRGRRYNSFAATAFMHPPSTTGEAIAKRTERARAAA